MSQEVLDVDGEAVRFVSAEDGRLRVESDLRGCLGELELVRGGTGFVARRPDGEALMTASSWGGSVTARFASRELAVRALMVTTPGPP